MTPTADIEVIGTRQSVLLSALIDTGFDGDICLPTTAALRLGLELVGRRDMELADGTVTTGFVFGGWVRFLGKKRSVTVHITESEDALIGTGLLEGCLLVIDFPAGTVRLSRKPARRRKRPQERTAAQS
jgi:clan AA aspartic protease